MCVRSTTPLGTHASDDLGRLSLLWLARCWHDSMHAVLVRTLLCCASLCCVRSLQTCRGMRRYTCLNPKPSTLNRSTSASWTMRQKGRRCKGNPDSLGTGNPAGNTRLMHRPGKLVLCVFTERGCIRQPARGQARGLSLSRAGACQTAYGCPHRLT